MGIFNSTPWDEDPVEDEETDPSLALAALFRNEETSASELDTEINSSLAALFGSLSINGGTDSDQSLVAATDVSDTVTPPTELETTIASDAEVSSDSLPELEPAGNISDTEGSVAGTSVASNLPGTASTAVFTFVSLPPLHRPFSGFSQQQTTFSSLTSAAGFGQTDTTPKPDDLQEPTALSSEDAVSSDSLPELVPAGHIDETEATRFAGRNIYGTETASNGGLTFGNPNLNIWQPQRSLFQRIIGQQAPFTSQLTSAAAVFGHTNPATFLLAAGPSPPQEFGDLFGAPATTDNVFVFGNSPSPGFSSDGEGSITAHVSAALANQLINLITSYLSRETSASADIQTRNQTTQTPASLGAEADELTVADPPATSTGAQAPPMFCIGAAESSPKRAGKALRNRRK